jgi:hypothetical protein
MKRSSLLILRIVETVLLVAVVDKGRQVEIFQSGERVYSTYTSGIWFGPGFKLWFNPSANHFMMSSLALGIWSV